MQKFYPTELPVPRLHQLLLGAIAPRPIAFASTMDASGKPNLSPFSFFNIFSANPPILIFSPARRGTNNTSKHSYENVKELPEVVINVVPFELVQQMSLSSSEYEKGVNEFEKAGLTPLPSEKVKPFRVKESPVHFECKVNQVIELGEKGGAGNLIICEVVLMHIAEAVLDSTGNIDPQKIRLVSRMGGDYYSKAYGDAVFTVPKPKNNPPGIGVDALPFSIKNSKILRGNDLGLLGNVAALPDETSVNEYKLLELCDVFIAHEKNKTSLEEALHQIAHELLETGKTEDAWKTLLAFNE